MTEQEKQVEIEKAVRARTMAINGLDEDRRDAWSAMEAALEAVGYFDMRAKLDALVGAGEGGRLCVACGRTLPASHDRTKPGLGCKSPDACVTPTPRD